MEEILMEIAEVAVKNYPDEILLYGAPYDPELGIRHLWVGISSVADGTNSKVWVTFHLSKDNRLLDVGLAF